MSRLFLFDVDGTLLTSGQAGQSAMEEALQVEFGKSIDECDISYAGRTDRAIMTDLMAWHGIENTPEMFLRFQTRYFELLPKHLADGRGVVLPGVTSVLDAINKESNDWTGLLTGNFEHSGWLKVRHFDLDHHFSFGAFGDHHVDRDDVARLASEAGLERHGDRLKDVWVIGDTPADVKCGRAIGARVMAVATGHFTVEELAACEPDVAVADMSQHDEILEALLG